MNARRFFTAAGVVAVAGVAGAISYRHQEHLAATHGQGSLAAIWPLCVDGLVTVTALAISTDRAAGHRARLWALVGFWIGVSVSVVTNWLATSGGVINHAVSAFPALAFLLAIESLSSQPRPAKPSREIAKPVGDSEAADRAQSRARSAPKPRAPRSDSNAQRVTKAAARNPGARPAQLAATLGLSDSTVRRYLKSDKAAAGSSAAPDMTVLEISNTTSAAPINGTPVLADISV